MEGIVAETNAQIDAVPYQASGKMVDVYKAISRDGRPMAEVISQFLYRGTYTAYDNTFPRKIETPMQVHTGSAARILAFAQRSGSISIILIPNLYRRHLSFAC